MTIKKNLAYILIIIICFWLIQLDSFGASSNRVTKVLTVMEQETLTGESVPNLVIKVLDPLEEGAIFYIHLEGASWINEVQEVSILKEENVTLELKKISKNQLQAKVLGGNIPADTSLNIPIHIEMTSEEAAVTIENNNTIISSGRYVVAQAKDYKGLVYTTEVPATRSGGEMAPLYIEEPFSNAFSKAVTKGALSVIQIQLQNNDYYFDLKNSMPKLEGFKGFEKMEIPEEWIKQIDDETLELTLPDMSKAQYVGAFKLSGIKLQSIKQNPESNQLTVSIQGDLCKTTTVDVLEIADYEVTLNTDKKTIYAGKKIPISFTLGEKIQDSIVKNRPTYFSLEGGAYFMVNEAGKVEVMVNGVTETFEPIMKNKQAIGFEVPVLSEEAKDYTFEVEAYVPNNSSGKIDLVAEGKSLIETLRKNILEVKTPFSVEVTPFETIAGVKDQVGGKILLKESAAAQLVQGEKIVIELEESSMKMKVPEVTVKAGDVRLGEPTIVGHCIEIPVIRRSNEASTIAIENWNMTVDQTVALGQYKASIGGGACSTLATQEELDPIWQGNFIQVTEAPKQSAEEVATIVSEEIVDENQSETLKTQVHFNVGESIYTVGNIKKAMDGAPYVEDESVLLPIKYIADALGLTKDQVKWDQESRTITLLVDQEIKLQIDSTKMQVGDETWILSTPPVISEGRTYVPVTELAAALQVDVSWDAESGDIVFIL